LNEIGKLSEEKNKEMTQIKGENVVMKEQISKLLEENETLKEKIAKMNVESKTVGQKRKLIEDEPNLGKKVRKN
jgi:hypothetical protein